MGDDKKTNPTGSEHHSKVKGAVVGGAVGGILAGKKGAAVGAEKQHRKNEKEEKGK